MPRPSRLRGRVASGLSLIWLSLIVDPIRRRAADLLHPEQVSDLVDHAPDGGGVGQLAGTVHFVQTEADQRLPLVVPPGDGALDLGNLHAITARSSHRSVPRPLAGIGLAAARDDFAHLLTATRRHGARR